MTSLKLKLKENNLTFSSKVFMKNLLIDYIYNNTLDIIWMVFVISIEY